MTKTVLAIECEEDVKLILQDVVEGMDCKLITAGCQEDLLKHTQSKPVLLLIDLEKINGKPDSFEKIRELFPHSKMIITTTDPHDEELYELKKTNQFSVLAMPFDIELVRKTIKQHISNAEVTR